MPKEVLSEEILNALVENTNVINNNSQVLSKFVPEEESAKKKELNEENKVSQLKVLSTLTAAEKVRYRNIGIELFKPLVSSLQKMIRQEKRTLSMSVDNDEGKMKDAIKIQYKKKDENKNKEGQKEKEGLWYKFVENAVFWGGILWGLIPVLKERFSGFFSNLWDKVTGIFQSVYDFFNPNNPESPIAKIVNVIKNIWNGVWGTIWGFIKPVFSGLAKIGSTIWSWIKGAWNNFITGPNGILSFGTKVWNSLKNFVSNGIGAIGSFIVDSIVNPLKSLFGGTKDDAESAAKKEKNKLEKASDEYEKEIKNGNSDANKRLENAENKVSDAEKAANNYSSETPVKGRTEAEVSFIKNSKNFSDQQLKEAAASAGLDAFLKKHNIKFENEEERLKYQKIFEQHVKVQNGKATVNMQEVANALQAQAKADSSFWGDESDAIEELRSMNAEEFDELNKAVENGMRESLKKQGAALVNERNKEALNGENLNNNVPPEQSQFAATQELIIQSVSALQSSLESFDTNIIQVFTNLFEEFVTKFFNMLKINVDVTTPKHEETKNYQYKNTKNSENNYNQTINDYSPTMVKVIPVSKSSFDMMNDKIYSLVEESIKIIASQNKLLEDIRDVISTMPEQNEKPNNIIVAQPTENNARPRIASNSRIARGLSEGLQKASSFWHDD